MKLNYEETKSLIDKILGLRTAEGAQELFASIEFDGAIHAAILRCSHRAWIQNVLLYFRPVARLSSEGPALAVATGESFDGQAFSKSTREAWVVIGRYQLL